MEQEPDTENVAYIDEYPDLENRLRLRRMFNQRRVGQVAATVIQFPRLAKVTPLDIDRNRSLNGLS